jgi:hypothetical protein
VSVYDRYNKFLSTAMVAPELLASVRSLYPWLRHVFAHGGYAGNKLRGALEGCGDHRDRQALRRGQRLRSTASSLVVERTIACSTAIAVWQRMLKQPSRARLLGSTSPVPN